MTTAPDPLEGVETLVIRQDAEGGRRFRITDGKHQDLLSGFEDSDSLARMALGRYRPCSFRLVTRDGMPYLELRRPFRFLFFELTIRDSRGIDLGRVERDFSLVRALYSVYDAIGREVYRIRRHAQDGAILLAMHGDRQAALLHRLTRDPEEEEERSPDYYRIGYESGVSVAHRKLLLGALFLLHEDGFGAPRVKVEVSVGGSS